MDYCVSTTTTITSNKGRRRESVLQSIVGVIAIQMKMERTPIWDTAKEFNSMPMEETQTGEERKYVYYYNKDE